MFARRQPLLAKARQINAVVFVLGTGIEFGVAGVVFKRFTAIPNAVAVLVFKFLAPDAGV